MNSLTRRHERLAQHGERKQNSCGLLHPARPPPKDRHVDFRAPARDGRHPEGPLVRQLLHTKPSAAA